MIFYHLICKVHFAIFAADRKCGNIGNLIISTDHMQGINAGTHDSFREQL
jgi:hypothetical protein